MKFYIDQSGKLGEHRRAATGGLIVEATLAKVGVLAYSEGGKTVRHLNNEEVLKNAMDGLATAPITNRHPARFVDTSNYSKVAKGHIVAPATFTDGHIRATLAIHDEALIQDIELGVAREVSMGYHVEVSNSPGVTETGEAYDVVRDAIEWNHIAIVPAGRAGKTVRLLLDSVNIPSSYGVVMFKIDGKEVAEDLAQAAFDAALARLEGLLEVSKAEAESLKTKLDETQRALDQAASDEAIEAAVAKKLAKKAEDEARVARLEAVKKAFPRLENLETRSDDAIQALYEIAKDFQDAEGLNLKATPVPPAAPKLSARERMIQDQRAALGKTLSQ